MKADIQPLPAVSNTEERVRDVSRALDSCFGVLDAPASTNATAPDSPPVGDRTGFLERQPRLKAIKNLGLLGENTRGYVEFVGAVRKDEAVVEAENAERSRLYERLAAETGVTADAVGQRRALWIAARAPAGHLLQNEKGEWRRKP